MAQAASAIETIERIISSRLKFVVVARAVDSGATSTSESKCRTLSATPPICIYSGMKFGNKTFTIAPQQA
jgi:hypothetical protein